MATEKQILANRKNAARSCGPKSAGGKLISSRNATRHGFYASAVLLPEEDRGEYIRLARGVVAFYLPQTVLEEEQVLIIQLLTLLRTPFEPDLEDPLPWLLSCSTGKEGFQCPFALFFSH